VAWLFWQNFDTLDREVWGTWAEEVVARYPSLLFSWRGGSTVLHTLAREHNQEIFGRLTTAITYAAPFGVAARACGTRFGGAFPDGSSASHHVESPLDIVLGDASPDEKWVQVLLENCSAASKNSIIPGWANPALLEERTLVTAFDLRPAVAADFLRTIDFAEVAITLQQPRKFNFSTGGSPGASRVPPLLLSPERSLQCT
jgi:hypothetical protein